MRFLLSLPIIALSFLVADVAANPHGNLHAARHVHDSIARRAPGDVAVHLNKRFSNAKFTFYDVGLGACGQWNKENDFIVALNTPQYGGGYPGPNCFKQIRISYGGKSTTATIMDQCPGCPYGGLDFSRGLFRFFASEGAGIIYGEWDFIDGNAPDPSPDPPKTTKTTTKPSPTPTSTKEEEPLSTPPPPSTTSSSSSSSRPPSSSQQPSSSSSSSSINYNSGAASNLAVPTGVTISDNVPHNILAMNQAIIAVGGIIVAGEKAA
jgi:hypothetical protein